MQPALDRVAGLMPPSIGACGETIICPIIFLLASPCLRLVFSGIGGVAGVISLKAKFVSRESVEGSGNGHGNEGCDEDVGTLSG